MSDKVFEALHQAFGPVLLKAAADKESPSDVVTALMVFCARECAFGHADLAKQMKFSNLGAQAVADAYGKAFANEVRKTLLQIDGVLN